MKRIILVSFLLVLSSDLFSYPIDPRPLRRLIEESEYIVSGHVIDVKDQKRKKDLWNDAVAVVKIRKVLKGQITESIIEIPFPVGLICPAPPRYKKGTDIIAFLDKDKNTYETHALSYGLKSGSIAELEVYEARILEMQSIAQIQNEDTRFLATVEWLVACAENEVTRWEATYELSPESDFMSYYAQTQQPAYVFMLTSDQKERLKRALFATQEDAYADIGLIDLVYPDNQREVYDLLVRRLESLSADNLWYADSYMQRIMHMKSTARMQEILKQFDDIQFERDKQNELLSIVQEFATLAKN